MVSIVDMNKLFIMVVVIFVNMVLFNNGSIFRIVVLEVMVIGMICVLVVLIMVGIVFFLFFN